MADFVVVAGFDDRAIVEGLKRVPGQAAEAAKAAAVSFDRGFSTVTDQLPAALSEGLSSAAAVGAKAGKALGDGIDKGLSGAGSGLTQTTRAVAGLGDEFTRSGSKVQASAAGLRTFADAQGKVRDEAGRMLSPLQRQQQGLEASAAGAAKSATSFRELASTSTLVEGAVAGLAFALTNALGSAVGSAFNSIKALVSSYAELDQELRLAATAAGEQGGYDKLSAAVQSVGIEASGTTQEVARLATSLVRAGFTVDQVTEAMPGVVRGAEATGTSFESMGSIVGSTLRGFGLDVKETSRVVDVLVQTANSSNASIEGLGYTFQYAAPIAKALNVSFEDVAAATGLMANAGIDASVAGTGLRTGLERLQKAAAGATNESMGLGRGQEMLGKAMRMLGADVTKANGELLPLDQVLLRLKEKFGALATAERVQLATTLFGEESASKFLAALNFTEDEISKMFNTIRDSKGATDIAVVGMASFSKSVKQLQGTAEAIGQTFGKVIAVGLAPFVAAANLGLGAISALPGPVKELAAGLTLLAAAYIAAKVAKEGFNLALKQEAVAGAVSEMRQLGGVIRGELLTDLSNLRAGFGAFIETIKAGRFAPAIAGLAEMAAGLRQLQAAQVTSGAVDAFNGLVGAITKGAGSAGTALTTMAAAISRSLIGATEAAGIKIAGLGAELLVAGEVSQATGSTLKGTAAILQGVFTASSLTASKALIGVGQSLQLLTVGTVTAGLGALAVGLAGVAAVATSYSVIMKDAKVETELARGPIEKMEAALRKNGSAIADTTALGGPFNRFMSDASSSTAAFVQQLVPIPGIAGLVKGALDVVGQALALTPVGLGIQGLQKLAEWLGKIYEAAQKSMAIEEANAAFGKLSNQAALATNAAANFTAEIKQLPPGQQLDSGKAKALKTIEENLITSTTALTEYKDNLLKQAEAQRDAGNKAYADELVRRAEKTDVELKLLDVSRVNLLRAAEARREAGSAAKEERMSLEAVVEALKAREQVNQVALLKAEASALQEVIKGNMTSAEAAARKDAAAVAAARNEIALIDDRLAAATKADVASGKFSELMEQRYQKQVTALQNEVKFVEARKAAQEKLNDSIAKQPAMDLQRQIDGFNALLGLTKARNDLDVSSFTLAGTRLQLELDRATQNKESEEEINRIKAQQAQLEAEAARARFKGLLEAQVLEEKIFTLVQRKKELEAAGVVNDAIRKELEARLAYEKAIKTENATLIDQKKAEYETARKTTANANEALEIVRQLAPIEKQVADATRQKALNEGQAALFQAQGKAELSQAAVSGQKLSAASSQTADNTRAWANNIVEVDGRISNSSGAFNSISRALTSSSKSATTLANSTRNVNRFGRASVGSFTGIGTGINRASSGAEEFVSSGIDSVTFDAADGASRLSSEMGDATSAALRFYDVLAAASGLPGARWAGGPVTAGQAYRINDGPNGRSLGQEAFLSSTGMLSLINRPANSLWRAPSSGMVLPAATTAKLQESGILPGGAAAPYRSRAGAPGRGAHGTARLEQAVHTLALEVAELRRKDWDVHVHERGRGRHQRLMEMLGSFS